MQRRYYYKITISLLILSTVPVLLISTFLYNRFTDRFFDYLTSTNQLALSQVGRSAALVMSDIETMAQLYNLDTDIAFFLANPFIADPYRFNSLQRRMANLHNSNDHIDSVYVIFDQWKYLISAGTTLTKRTYDPAEHVEGFFRFSEIADQQWFYTYAANAGRARRVVPFAAGGEAFISVVVPLTDDLMRSLGSLVFYVRGEDLLSTVEGSAPNLAIAYGETLLSISQPSHARLQIDRDSLKADIAGRLRAGVISGTEQVTVRGREFIVTVTQSEEDPNWTFFSYVPVEEFLAEIVLLRNVTLIGGLAIVAACIALALIVGRRIYTPIGLIARRIEVSGIATVQDEDEVQLIGDALTDMETIKDHMDSYVEANREVFRNTFLLDLVRGQFQNADDIAERMSFFGLSFPHPIYYVLLIVVDKAAADLQPVVTEYDRSAWKAQILAITAGLATQLGLTTRAFEALSSQICVIVNVGGSEDEEHDIVSQYAEQLRKIVSETLPFTASIGISSPVASLSHIDRAYESASSALQRRFVAGRNCILYADSGIGDLTLASSLEPAHGSIANAVIAGDTVVAKDLVSGFFERLHLLPTERYAYAKNAVGLLLAGVLNRIAALDEHLHLEVLDDDLWMRLNTMSTLEDAEMWLIELFGGLSEAIRAERAGSVTNSRVAMVEEFIHANFRRSISLVDMSEYVRLNPAYLSKLFKDETGKNISEYLNQLRVQESKQFLRDPTQTISEVATEVGYKNTQSYTRFFKKYEGVTPDEYRKRVLPAGSIRLAKAVFGTRSSQ